MKKLILILCLVASTLVGKAQLSGPNFYIGLHTDVTVPVPGDTFLCDLNTTNYFLTFDSSIYDVLPGIKTYLVIDEINTLNNSPADSVKIDTGFTPALYKWAVEGTEILLSDSLRSFRVDWPHADTSFFRISLRFVGTPTDTSALYFPLFYTMSTMDLCRTQRVFYLLGSPQSLTLCDIDITHLSGSLSLCPGDTSGYIDVNATGGSGMLTYAWNGFVETTTGSISGLSPGYYEVRIGDTLGCYIDADYTIDSICNSIESQLANALQVYPNPAERIVNLSFSQKENKIDAIHLYDAMGRELQTETQVHQENYQMDISSQPKGLYYIRIDVGQYQVVKKVMLK